MAQVENENKKQEFRLCRPEPLSPIHDEQILWEICKFLSHKDMINFRLVCRQWKEVSSICWKDYLVRGTLNRFSRDNPYYLDGEMEAKYPPLTVLREYSPAGNNNQDVIGAEEVYDFFKRHEQDVTMTKFKSSSFMTCNLRKWQYFGSFPPEVQQGAKWLLNEILIKNVKILILDRCLLSVSANEFFLTLCKMKNLEELTIRGTYFQLRPSAPAMATISEISPLFHLSVIDMNYEYCGVERNPKYFFPWELLMWAAPNLETLIFTYSNETNREFAFRQFHIFLYVLKKFKSVDEAVEAIWLSKLKVVIWKCLETNQLEGLSLQTYLQFQVEHLLTGLAHDYRYKCPPKSQVSDERSEEASTSSGPKIHMSLDLPLRIDSMDISISFENPYTNVTRCLTNLCSPFLASFHSNLSGNASTTKISKTEESKTFDKNENLNQDQDQDCIPVEHDGPQPLPVNHDDILPKICKFLPVKDLKNFRLVCKQWEKASLPRWKNCVTHSLLNRVCRGMKNPQHYWDVPIQHATLTVFTECSPADKKKTDDVIGAMELYKFFKNRDPEMLKDCFRSSKLKNWEFFGNFPSLNREKYLGASWFLNQMAENVVSLTLEGCCFSVNAMEFFPTLSKFRNLETLVLTGTWFTMDPAAAEPTPSEVTPLKRLKSLQINFQGLAEELLPNYFFPWKVLLSAMPNVTVLVLTYANDPTLCSNEELKMEAAKMEIQSEDPTKCDIKKKLMKDTEDPWMEIRFPTVLGPTPLSRNFPPLEETDAIDLWSVPFF